MYDETGVEVRLCWLEPAPLAAHGQAQDSVSGEQFDGLYKYYRDVYAKARLQLENSATGRLTPPQVTPEDVCKYETTYRGSAAERHDLLELYTRFEGDTKLCALCAFRRCAVADHAAQRLRVALLFTPRGGLAPLRRRAAAGC